MRATVTSFLVGSLALGCASPQLRPLPRLKPRVAEATVVAANLTEEPPALPATTIAHLPFAEGGGVVVARRGGTGLLLEMRAGRLWAYPFDTAKPAAETPLLGANASSAGAADAGPMPADATSLVARPLREGFLAAWAQGDVAHPEIAVRALDAHGVPSSEARVVGTLDGRLRWLDVMASGTGALVAVESGSDDTRVLRVSAFPPAVATPGFVEVTRGMLAWHGVATPQGAVIATVERVSPAAVAPAHGRAPAALPTSNDRVGQVRLREIDAHGRVSAPHDVTTDATAMPDVQVAALAGSYLVAWTETTDEASVRVAAVAPGGALTSRPHAPLPRLGAQALVSLVPSGDATRALLMWEDLATVRKPREFRLTAFGPDAQLIAGAEAALELDPLGDPDALAAIPHLVPDGAGFLAMTLAPLDFTAGAGPAGRRAAPFFVHFSASLAVESSEPVRLPNVPNHGLPYLTRSEQCDESGCTALCTSQTEPAPLWLVELPRRPGPWRAPAHTLPATQPPFAERLSTIGSVDGAASDVAATSDARGSVVAWLGNPDANGMASLALRIVAPDGTPGGGGVLAPKAIATGGLALAPALGPDGKPTRTPNGKRPAAAVAWAGMNESAAQVFVALCADDGSKITQKTLTVRRRPAKGVADGGVTSIDLAADGRGGYVAVWVDERDGDPEVYAARLDAELNRRGMERRVTNVPGDASEVRVLVRGERAFVAWDDARDDVSGGSADVYLAILEGEALNAIGQDRALQRTPAHSRTPSLTATPAGVLLSWIEEPHDGSTPSSARVARLDDQGRPIGDVDSVAADDAVTAVSVSCVNNSCRGLLAHGDGALGGLDVFVLPAHQAGVGARKALLALTTPVLDLAPLAADLSSVAFADHDRLRRLAVRW